MYEWLNNPETIDPTFSLLTPDEQAAILATLRAAKDASTTRNPTTLGFTKTPLPKVTFEVPSRPKRTLAEEFAEELKLCDGCTGVCQKEIDRYYIPVVGELRGQPIRLQRRCKFGKKADNAKKVRSSKIPERYVGKTLENYTCDASNRAAVDFAKNAFSSLKGAYFYGECGTGKTFLASIIAQDFLRRGKNVLFVKVPSLLDDIKATFGGNSSELAILNEIEAADLVVLDDFGMEKPTQWAGATLCKILDMRYDGRSMTLITSNLSPRELAQRLNNATDGDNLNGSRIFDRLKEICKPILFKGTTRRN